MNGNMRLYAALQFYWWFYRGRVVSILTNEKLPNESVEIVSAREEPPGEAERYVRLIVYALEQMRAPCIDLRLPAWHAHTVLDAVRSAYPGVRLHQIEQTAKQTHVLIYLV